MQSKPGKQFTGRQMAAILVIGLGIVAAVNFTMASLATGGFHGIVVENSYVASQQFNDWLDEAEAARELGWTAKAARQDDGHVLITSEAVPQSAVITAELRRPLGEREYASLAFIDLGDGLYRSDTPVDNGRWTMRLFIEADGIEWAQESELR